MKSRVKRWADAIFEPFFVQVYIITSSFLAEIPLIMAWVQWWKLVGLIWAALTILYDLCTRRRCLKSRGAVCVFGLLAAYAVTALAVRIRYPYAFQETYLDLFCSAAVLLVLYPPKERWAERLRILNRLLIFLTTVAAAAGIVMFLLHIGGYYYSDITDYDYPVGFANARLTGVFRNAIYPTPLIGVGAALMEWPRTKGTWRRLLLAVCLLLNAWHVLLANSKALLYALAVMSAVVAFFEVRRRLADAAPWRAWGAGALCALLLAGAMLGLAAPVRRMCGNLPVYLRQIVAVPSPFSSTPTGGTPYKPPANDPEPLNKVEMDRDVPENYGAMTGRPVIWRQGWNFFLQRPLLGYGPYALKDQVRIFETSSERLSHFHSLPLQSLVSVGVLGSVFFFGLLAIALWALCRGLFTETGSPDYPVLVGLAALLIALLFVNLADVTLFFLSKNSEFVFWTYLGYAMTMVGGKPLRIDRPLRQLDGRLPRFGG